MIAITGATGLLGTHLVDRFAEAGLPVIALHRGKDSLRKDVKKVQCDLLDPISLRDAFKDVHTVVHSAAMVSFNPRKRHEMFAVNIEGTKNVVNACLDAGVKNLIHISSVSALGRKNHAVIDEESKWSEENATDYGQSKYQAELEVFRGAEEGLVVSLVSPSVILSGAQPHRSSATLLDYIWNEKPFFTSGSLNYVDARDVAEAVFRLYKEPQPFEKFILSGGSIPYRDFFSLAAKRFGKKPPSIRLPKAVALMAGVAEELRCLVMGKEPAITRQTASMAVLSFSYNSSKVKEALGLEFRSLAETLDWCCAEYVRNVKGNN